jgi:DNA-binding transcriptional regulator YbjK
MTLAASLPLPCSAMTGLSACVCPGGRAIAQFVATPPRAEDTNDPVTIVGCTAAGAGSSGGGGANGASTLVIDTPGPAADGRESSIVPSAKAPAAPAVAPTPSRSTARRLSSGMRVIMPPVWVCHFPGSFWPVKDSAKPQYSGHLTGSMTGVTAAVTPKGERRRHALVSAAADLLCEGGFDAVRHRAVARRAGLPLASTTYYFSSLDDLVVHAVEYVGAQQAAQLRIRLAGLSRRRRGAESTADVLLNLLLGDCPSAQLSEQLISWYERYIASARQPWLRDVQRRLREQRTAAVVDAVQRSGRTIRGDRLRTLMCAVDGAVIAALVDDGGDLHATARAGLVELIDVLAPLV